MENAIIAFTGLLDVTRDDDELAANIAHEISHVLLKHDDQNWSITALSGLVGAATVFTNPFLRKFNLYSLATLIVFGNLFLLPRDLKMMRNELEADSLGKKIIDRGEFNSNGIHKYINNEELKYPFFSVERRFTPHLVCYAPLSWRNKNIS
ncbi:hypothetical protein O9G_005534 [Rozella allomycis CSF55]|uniref:Peptidase M48 domain-containing protein n=1 Tax=Rozella allomycis (strain CSF55) TaxID=988480 RepID=A0A075APV8_ROZAC|nr:hypothetical protein O9G_005534 [Rozella allomycis CSF55]|eukprot:EPZ32133.1 hypothetical protein O9G_005534 [Rozella allomycis CSF55]